MRASQRLKVPFPALIGLSSFRLESFPMLELSPGIGDLIGLFAVLDLLLKMLVYSASSLKSFSGGFDASRTLCSLDCFLGVSN